METKTVTAKAQFVKFVEGYGMIVSNGDGDKVKVPVAALEAFAGEGLIAAPKGGKQTEADTEEAPAA